MKPTMEWSPAARARAILKVLGIEPQKQVICERGCAHTAMEVVEAHFRAHERDAVDACMASIKKGVLQ